MSSWNFLIRFGATDGNSYFATVDAPQDSYGQLTGYESLENFDVKEKGKVVEFKKLLSPAPAPGNEIICIGANYAEHAKEAGLAIPTDPIMWYKPRKCLAGPGDIPIAKSIQNDFIDFEGEFTIVTSKECKDISEAEAPDYILGYTIGNDLTARMLQDPKRAGGQFTRAKGFDHFAPTGPAIASAAAFGSLEGKRVRTTVNGKVFQDSKIDLIHGPAKLVSYLSQGTTLPAYSMIMTGSPPGIGYFQDPKVQLKDGDVVEIEISGIGKLKNTIRFE